MTLYESRFAKFTYDPARKLLLQEWIGFAKHEEFKTAIDSLAPLAHQYEFHLILSDTRKQGLLKQESTDYAAALMPGLVAAGLRRMAFVLPESVFTRMSVKSFSDNSQKVVGHSGIIAHFGDVETAMAWLLEAETVA